MSFDGTADPPARQFPVRRPVHVLDRMHRVAGLRMFSRLAVPTTGMATDGVAGAPAPSGADLPILIVPGMTVVAYLRPWQEALAARGRRVYLLELPGFARSDTPQPRPDIDGHAEAVRAWMDAAGIPVAEVIGHSYGTQVAARLAVRHPHRVARLVLGGPIADPRWHGGPGLALGWLLDGLVDPPSLLRAQTPEWFQAGLRTILTALVSALRADLAGDVARLSMPLLVLRGARDPIAGGNWCRELARSAAGLSHEIPRAGHAFPFTHAGQAAQLVTDTAATPAAWAAAGSVVGSSQASRAAAGPSVRGTA
jgi:pimeloyl-ACP methyl ester carboxylesterase